MERCTALAGLGFGVRDRETSSVVGLCVNSLLKNAQTEMSAPPAASGSLKKVGQTFHVFQQAVKADPEF